MKIICDCGNECFFNEYDGREKLGYTEDEGQYVIIQSEGEGFHFWEEHDVIGIVCDKCGKAIWMFV